MSMALSQQSSNFQAAADLVVQQWPEIVRGSYRDQLKRTSQVARQVRQLIEELEDSPGMQIKDSVEFQKFHYISMQMGFHRTIIQTVTAQDALLQRDDLGGQQSDRDQAVANQTYELMTDILRALETGFRRVLGMPDGCFEELFTMVKAWIERNPKAAMAALPVGGAVAGASAAAWHYQFGVCIFGLQHFCLPPGAILASAGAGFLVGVCATATCIGLEILFQKLRNKDKKKLRKFEDEQRQKLEDMVDKLKAMTHEETIETFQSLRDLCQTAFCQTDFHDGDEVECSICLEDIEPAQAVRSPNCQGRHFYHAACWREYVAARHTQQCTHCGV